MQNQYRAQKKYDIINM